ncbi:proline-rich protein 18 [Rhineura floridana]|uniref:proline-rich protein 18 n=1 Tax=Rhineura floridana TaxID=261503 RepID=UPI002AC875D9|nr:proline-rich protein 18 [Rhineura floridana]
MSLPPIAPPPAAAPRLQLRNQQQPSPPVAAPKKAAAPLAPAKPPRKGRGAPSEHSGAFSSSWPSASLQKQLPRNRAAQASRNPTPPKAAATVAPVLGAPQSLARGRSVLGPPGLGTRSCESPCAAQAGRGEAALRFSLSLPPEAIRVLQRRSLEKQHQQKPRGRTPCSASPDATKRLLAGGSAAGGDLRALLQVSLLNEHHRYDDVEYEEEVEGVAGGPGACTADEGLVRKCTEWLRGVENAAARDRTDKLDTLPHLSTL